MSIKTYALKAANSYYWWMDKLDKQRYIREYPKYLRRLGVRISEEPGDCWISPTVFLDSAGYGLIEIGDDVTISFDVAILVHDYSINNALRVVGESAGGRHRMVVRPVSIGDNCFVGARATLLPGATVGEGCIIGAGSVVRGGLPPRSVVAGNPARVVGSVDEYARRHLERGDIGWDGR